MKLDERREELWFIGQCLAGNTEAFAFLVKKYEGKLYHFACRMLGNQEDARELTQEALLKAFQALGSYRRQYAFSTWIYRILTNLCINFLEKKRSSVPFREEIEDVRPAMDHLEQEEFWGQVENALGRLPAKERSVFVLATFEKLPVTEIARILDIPRGTVCWRLFQARKKLQNLLSVHEN